MNQLLLVLLLLCFGIIAFTYLFANWRHALILVLLLVIIEGALRKWVLPQASDLLYFLKDLVLIPVYLYALNPQRAVHNYAPIPKILGFLLVLNAVWCFIQIFNPSLGSPVVGLLGLRAYLFYLPLMWLIPRLFTDKTAFIRFLRIYLLLTIPLGILGIVQYFSPGYSPINVYVGGSEANALVGANVRITGSFSYIAGYTTYLIVTFAIVLPFLLTPQPPLWRWLTLVELLLIVGNSLMTGSRGVILAQILILLGFIIINGLSRPSWMVSTLTKFLVPGLLLMASLFYFFDQALDNFILRATNSDSVSARIVESYVQPFSFIRYTELSGYGIGATLPGGAVLAQRLGLSTGEFIPVYFESEMGRVMLEVGPFGFMLWYGLRLYLLYLQWSVFRRLHTPFLRYLALAALLVCLTQFNGQLVANPTFIFYYWFLNSFILLLPRLEEQEANRQLIKVPYAPNTALARPSYRQPFFS